MKAKVIIKRVLIFFCLFFVVFCFSNKQDQKADSKFQKDTTFVKEVNLHFKLLQEKIDVANKTIEMQNNYIGNFDTYLSYLATISGVVGLVFVLLAFYSYNEIKKLEDKNKRLLEKFDEEVNKKWNEFELNKFKSSVDYYFEKQFINERAFLKNFINKLEKPISKDKLNYLFHFIRKNGPWDTKIFPNFLHMSDFLFTEDQKDYRIINYLFEYKDVNNINQNVEYSNPIVKIYEHLLFSGRYNKFPQEIQEKIKNNIVKFFSDFEGTDNYQTLNAFTPKSDLINFSKFESEIKASNFQSKYIEIIKGKDVINEEKMFIENNLKPFFNEINYGVIQKTIGQ